MTELISNLSVPNLVVSFNNEGYISREEMISLLSQKGEVFVVERDFKRYVGAKIGIYNPSGEKVGKKKHTKNKEYIFVVPADPDRWRSLLR
jgi:adenine-specific DNA-methyltransferase